MTTVRPAIRVNYEELLAAYWNNLTAVLRGFRVGADLHFLDAWVPADDVTRDIVSIVEAALDSELESLTIELGAKTLSRANPDELGRAAGVYGAVNTDRRGANFDLHVTLRRRESNLEPSPTAVSIARAHRGGSVSLGDVSSADSGLAETLPPDYADALRDLVTGFSHRGLPAEQAGLELVSTVDGHVRFAAVVAPGDGHIEKVGFEGEASQEQCRLLELLCQVIEGKPIQDASDHAAIELEYRLRPSHGRRAVPGIVMPENVSAAFERPRRLVRDLMAEYRARQGYDQTQNFYAAPTSPHWRQLSESERIARIQVAIDGHPSGCGVRVVRLEGLQRFIIEFEQPPFRAGGSLLALEKHVKANVESTLSLGLVPRLDRNALRRLNERG